MRRAVLACLALAVLAALPARAAEPETAIFAGGCFWCVESDFDKVRGVLETVSGYTGGTVERPSYAQVSAGGAGHLESVKVVFDPDVVSYETLATVFFRTVDPTDAGGQFCDRGPSYATAVFVNGPEQRAAAEQAKAEAAKALSAEVVTPIRDAGPFWPAEGYHQDYHDKNPLKYRFYRWNCGRDARVKALWGATPEETLKPLG